MSIDYVALRHAIARLDAQSSSSMTGEDRPLPENIFAPEHHVGALDPNTPIVLGARGTGKSFWAGVLANTDTREVASRAYPHLGLVNLLVALGFTGQEGDRSVSRATIDQQVMAGNESTQGRLLWRCVVLRAARLALEPNKRPQRISNLMMEYADPEFWEEAMEEVDSELIASGRRLMVVFDALDSLAFEWARLRELTDTLLEVAWSIRGYQSLRIKLFLRPDQVGDLGLRFVELPKMISGATKLIWTGTDLYGMFFSRLATDVEPDARRAFVTLLEECSVPPPPKNLVGGRRWSLSYNKQVQARVFSKMAGSYMGKSNKKGRTYDWPINHLADGHGEVTPRSFLSLLREAAVTAPLSDTQAITAEGIRVGLRAASKVRLEQLDTEFKWIKRVLAPLARLQVPCFSSVIIDRWDENETVAAIAKRATAREFLSPFDGSIYERKAEQLIQRLMRLGVLIQRNDGRYDMPDLFRVAARLLKKGSVPPT